MTQLSAAAWKSWQTMVGLKADGIAGPITLTAYNADKAILNELELRETFSGSLALLVQEEGFHGDLYWPKFNSGATLDFGFDLSWQTYEWTRALYGHLWPTERLMPFCSPARGHRGPRGVAAERMLRDLKARSDNPERLFPLARTQAAQILPHAAAPYWLECIRLWPDLPNLPCQFQSALLSVCYSTWSEPISRARDAFYSTTGDPIKAVAKEIRESAGFPVRREREAALIETLLS